MPKIKCPICGNINDGYSPRCGNCGERFSATTMLEESGPRELSPKIVRDVIMNVIGPQYPYDDIFNTFYGEIMLMRDCASITNCATIHDLLSYDDGNVIRVLYDLYSVISKNINYRDNSITEISITYIHDMKDFEYSPYVRNLINRTLRFMFKRKFIYTKYFMHDNSDESHIRSTIHILLVPDDNKFLLGRIENNDDIPIFARRYDCNTMVFELHEIMHIVSDDIRNMRIMGEFPHEHWRTASMYVDYCRYMAEKIIYLKCVVLRTTNMIKWSNAPTETDDVNNKPKEE